MREENHSKKSCENRRERIPPQSGGKESFVDKLRELLAGAEFTETAELAEARRAVLEALATTDLDPDLMRTAWAEYAKVCEQAVDALSPAGTHPQIRAQLQIASLIHKALIFREAGNVQRYGEELVDAEEYAHAMRLDAVSAAIGKELDSL